MTMALDQIIDCLTRTGLERDTVIRETLESLRSAGEEPDGNALLEQLTADSRITPWQSGRILSGNGFELTMGNYILQNLIGEGGMGTVFKALHRRMQRVVAIKTLKLQDKGSDSAIGRFKREVHAAARLNHQNIIAAYDADECELGHFLVMEFVDGSDLGQIVKKQGPLRTSAAIDCILQSARGLSYAHSQGVIHRDIKPANLMRDAGGVIRVADLGLAQLKETATGENLDDGLSVAGTMSGTVDYMPPEQAMDSSSVDERADIYSLGCTLFFLMTGKGMFAVGSSITRLMAHQSQPRPSISEIRDDVPEMLEKIYERMTAINANERFQSMDEVVAELEKLAAPTSETNWADLTAFVIENSRMQSRVIQKYLNVLGIDDVHLHSTGTETLEELDRMPSDLIIATAELPDMTGVEMARRIREEIRWSHAAVILMCSSELTSDAQERLSQLAAIEVLTKPFDVAGLQQAVENAIKAERPEPRLAGFENMEVMVVDDSAVWRRRMLEVLSQLGFESFTVCTDGTEAVEALAERHFDLVVTDYNMPQMDGNELIRHIRNESDQRAVTIVMVTTEYDPIKLAEVYQLGVSAICNKSFDPQLVRNILIRLFG
ncbi:MAG TPA: response regulator [Planctomycetes bacterium]|nr:response regulator [Planctomycetota bacterium]